MTDWIDYPTDASAFSVAFKDEAGNDDFLLLRAVAKNEHAARRCIQTVAITMLANAGLEIPWAEEKSE